MHTALEHTRYQVLLANSGLTSAGTGAGTLVQTGTFVPISGFQNQVVLFEVGTVTAGSIVELSLLRSTAATGGTVSQIAASKIGPFTGTVPAVYGIEVRNELFNDGTLPLNGTAFIGARVQYSSGGTAAVGALLVQHNPRNLPTANNLAGSALVLH